MTGEIPTSTRAELEELQLGACARPCTARTSTCHYRRAFAEAGVTPDDLRSLADLARFPFLTKADLRENYLFGMFAVPREQVRCTRAAAPPEADRGRLHRRGPRHLVGADGALDPRGRRTAG